VINFSINGFGRIGRSATRVWLNKHTDTLDLKAINTSGSLPASGWAYLLKHDTAYGLLDAEVTGKDLQDPKKATDQDPLIGYLVIKTNSNHLEIPVLAQKDPNKIPWRDFSVDIVIESTGIFTSLELARQHLTGGAKTVILSAPPQGGSVSTAVIGVNEDQLINKDKANSISVISNASCTTNCVAPVAAVIHAHIGIAKAALLTVHGYTDDQNLQDNSHHDLRRARAAAANIVPTSTGAALATTETIPDLRGLFDGIALRVPVITGSITDFTFLTRRATSVEEINDIFTTASHNPLYQGILAVSSDPLVSSDIIGRSESAIVDLPMTRVIDGDLVKVLAWYDNEWGYSNRLVEQVQKVGENLT
jgi:glyceraldehyde 3-phosphate dehydrogenase